MAAWVGVCMLVVVAPFEAMQPLVRLPGQSLTTVEAFALLALIAWISSPGWRGDLARQRLRAIGPWLAVVGASFVAALLAPAHRANAVHMTGRLAMACGVFLLTVSGVTTRTRLHVVLAAAAVAGVLIAIPALLETRGNEWTLGVLRIFRPGVAVVGDQVRASGPFQYPTIASMYLEIVFALGLGLLPVLAASRRDMATLALAGGLALTAQAIALTFSRAGVLTMAASLVFVGAQRVGRVGFDRGVRALAVLALVVAIQVVSSRPVQALGLRMTTETQTSWYRATIEAPPRLSLRTGELVEVPVSVTNRGRASWSSSARPPFRLAYHWLRDDGRVAVWEGERTSFLAPVPPGDTASVAARVRAPGEPGRFRLMWDVELFDQLWFSSEPDAADYVTDVDVAGAALAPLGPSAVQVVPKANARPGRLVLWRAALRMLTARPLTGVGPDNFRLLYGEHAGVPHPDTRTHSNSMYIEVLVGTGILGGLALAWFLRRAVPVLARCARRVDLPAAAGVAAAGLAIAGHGFVDSFLSFTPTYLLMAVAAGLAWACANLDPGHADRV